MPHKIALGYGVYGTPKHAIDGELVPDIYGVRWVTTHLLEHPSPRTRTHVEDRHLIPGSRRDDARL